MRIDPLGDRAVLIDIGGGIDPATLRRVRDITARIERARIPAVTDIVAGYTTVAVHYEPLRLTLGGIEVPSTAFRQMIEDALSAPSGAGAAAPPRTVEIPVLYGGAHGPDLGDVAQRHGMSADEVVAVHTAGTYTVHMIGFVPGFPYLGGLDPRLATPRRDTPRTVVPAGSVGIGGEQTGVYPIESPGGWHLIGHTPLALFDPERDAPALLHVGDLVRFRAIDAREHDALARGEAS